MWAHEVIFGFKLLLLSSYRHLSCTAQDENKKEGYQGGFHEIPTSSPSSNNTRRKQCFSLCFFVSLVCFWVSGHVSCSCGLFFSLAALWPCCCFLRFGCCCCAFALSLPLLFCFCFVCICFLLRLVFAIVLPPALDVCCRCLSRCCCCCCASCCAWACCCLSLFWC